MSQPEWKLVYATDYSALYTDATGVYDPELTIAQTLDDVDEDDIEATVAHVYRFDLPRLEVVRIPDDKDPRVVREYLVPHGWGARADLPHDISRYDEWFHKDLASVASSHDHASIREDLCSDDVNKRAHAYESIGGHFGYDNLDGYPDELTATEFAEWPERGPKLSTSERTAFTKGYISCALWCGVQEYKHDDECGYTDALAAHDANAADTCSCTPELVSSDGPHDEGDLDDELGEMFTREAHEFYADNVVDLRTSTLDMDRAGHDLWLTRNHHGAGYWDEKSRGVNADKALDALTKAAHVLGEMSLIAGDDGKITEM